MDGAATEGWKSDPVAWRPTAPRPPRGAAMSVVLPDGHALWTTVTGAGDDDLTLALPPMLPAGTALTLSWTDPPRVYAATALVLPTTDACLRLSLGAVRRLDRRRETRIAPRVPLAAHAEIGDGPFHAAVRDVSASGIAFWADDAAPPIGTPLRLTLTLASGEVLAADVPARVVRVVADAHGPATIGCACEEPEAMAPVVARAV